MDKLRPVGTIVEMVSSPDLYATTADSEHSSHGHITVWRVRAHSEVEDERGRTRMAEELVLIERCCKEND